MLQAEIMVEHIRPDGGVKALVLVDLFRLQAEHHSHPLHVRPP